MEVSSVIKTINQSNGCQKHCSAFDHSDRGSQYFPIVWHETTKKMQLSYSHSGYPYDNAYIKSFHSLIKREWLNRFNIQNQKHAYRLVFEYIEIFYNTVRIHSHCDYMSLNEFESLLFSNETHHKEILYCLTHVIHHSVGRVPTVQHYLVHHKQPGMYLI